MTGFEPAYNGTTTHSLNRLATLADIFEKHIIKNKNLLK